MNELIQPATEVALSTEAQAFELLQRQAKMLSASTLVPKEFQGNMANCAIGLNIAKRLGADPFMVLQNIDIIHGRPSWRATFLIAMVNASGRFSPLQFREDGAGDKFGCSAFATNKATGEVVEGPKVDWEMVKAEGWLSKSGSKWKTMPQLMFRYRAAAFFARIYAPDITLGMQTAEEIYDAPPEPRNVTPVTAHVEPLANPYLPTSKPEPTPAAAPEPVAEPDPELPMEPASKVQTLRGYFERYETADSPENAKKQWRRYDLFFTVAGGPERKASTFSSSVAEPLEWLSKDDEILVEIEDEARGLKLLSVEKATGKEGA